MRKAGATFFSTHTGGTHTFCRVQGFPPSQSHPALEAVHRGKLHRLDRRRAAALRQGTRSGGSECRRVGEGEGTERPR